MNPFSKLIDEKISSYNDVIEKVIDFSNQMQEEMGLTYDEITEAYENNIVFLLNRYAIVVQPFKYNDAIKYCLFAIPFDKARNIVINSILTGETGLDPARWKEYKPGSGNYTKIVLPINAEKFLILNEIRNYIKENTYEEL